MVVPNVAVLIVEGFQVPINGVLLVEKVGSGGAISFKQYKFWIPEKVSVILFCGFTVTVIDWGVPKHPLSNVFIVYTTVPLVFPEFNKVWEIVFPESFEIPVTLVALAVHTIVAFGSEAIKFKEVVSFEHIVVAPVKVMVVVFIPTVTLIVCELAHWFGLGVKR